MRVARIVSAHRLGIAVAEVDSEEAGRGVLVRIWRPEEHINGGALVGCAVGIYTAGIQRDRGVDGEEHPSLDLLDDRARGAPQPLVVFRHG